MRLKSLLSRQLIDADDIADSLADAYENEHQAQRETMENNIVNAKEKIKTLEQLTTRFYEDLLSGTITQNIFSSMMERTSSEIEELKEQVAEWESELEKDVDTGNAKKWVDLIKDYADITELDAETLNHLVRRIVVHEEILEDGTRDISLEIHYNFRPTDDSKTYNLNEYAEEHSFPKAI